MTTANAASHTSVTREPFGEMPDGRPVERVRLRGAGGFEVCVITFGAAIQALYTPDRHGRCADIVLGHETLEPYLAYRRFFGATVGRYANRIAGGAFELDGAHYRLAVNDGPNALHGGLEGFDRKLWVIEAVGERPSPFVTLSHVSPDGEEGYPGTLKTTLTYSLTGGQELSISFSAVTDRRTIVNLTHHGFFNLGGVELGGNILDHVLTLHADAYLPVDATAIPLGGPEDVAGTAFDFRQARRIGECIREAHEQLRLGRGYDHNFCLQGGASEHPRFAALVEHEGSGRVMEILTDQPGLQFYSGNFLDGRDRGKYGRLYRQSDAFCLEPQNWPDAPNRKGYPPARLDPGGEYRHTSVYRFSTAGA
jgi:aldose 1-epimerase